MAKAKRPNPQASATSLEPVTLALVKLGVFLTLLVISPAGRETFRLPKDLLLRAEGILLLTIAAAGLAAGALSPRLMPWKSPAVVLALIAAGWAIATALASTNKPLSVLSLLTIVPATVIFLATFLVARGRGFELLTPLLWAGALNCLLYLSQLLGIFNPIQFTSAFKGHNAATGFLGNANDLGSALLPIAVAAAALAFADPEHRRRNWFVAGLVTLTVFASVSIAAIGALVVALVVMTLLLDWRKTAVALVALAIVGAIAAAAYAPFRYRVEDIANAARGGSFDRLLSGRLASFSSAIAMLHDHSLTGVGPGTFGWNYLPYKIEVTEADPELFRDTAAANFNFEEVHNDHLEILAETGIPGYAVFVAALVWLMLGSVRRPRGEETGATPTQSWARLVSLPLASGFAVIALAQYPLQLASAMSATLFVAALSAAWRPSTAPGAAPQSAARPRLGTGAIVAIAIVLSVVPVWFLAVVPWGCNVTTREMEAAMADALRGNPQARAYLAANTGKAERCRRHVRHDQSLNVAVASAYSLTGRSTEALAVYEDALRYDRRPEIYFNIGGIYLRTGYSEKAFDNFLTAARFNPGLADRISGDAMKSRVKYELARRQNNQAVSRRHRGGSRPR
ncbi:MAG: O-antigen ligase family protein [Thermoanaerobaculia bacterium]|nr:O-antigen ligase family protein [Thermoanaerobaculia bacterium]